MRGIYIQNNFAWASARTVAQMLTVFAVCVTPAYSEVDTQSASDIVVADCAGATRAMHTARPSDRFNVEVILKGVLSPANATDKNLLPLRNTASGIELAGNTIDSKTIFTAVTPGKWQLCPVGTTVAIDKVSIKNEAEASQGLSYRSLTVGAGLAGGVLVGLSSLGRSDATTATESQQVLQADSVTNATQATTAASSTSSGHSKVPHSLGAETPEDCRTGETAVPVTPFS
jgi:hypothetical protein